MSPPWHSNNYDHDEKTKTQITTTPQRYHIDGPRISSSALQVVSEALDIQQQNEETILSTEDPPAIAETPETTLNPQHDSQGHYSGKTIVASDSDVSNGFVMCGRSLPYVFEANESGIRKRSSKILPVCAVCGKRFVCVTTMKRHLVTHTGEKPFSCKVCGKQYTQKGNLRVHERTHRNDRPFECNICHQKFYRKEPMQKHQWRQHGIVHFKTRPGTTSNGSSAPPTSSTTTTSTTLQQPPKVELLTITPTAAPPRPIILEGPPRPLIPVRPAPPTSYTALVDSLKASRENSSYRSILDPSNAPIGPPIAHQTHIDVPKFSQPPPQHEAVRLEFTHSKIREESPYSSSPPSPSFKMVSDTEGDESSNQSFTYSSVLAQSRDNPAAPNSHLLIIPTMTNPSEVVVAAATTIVESIIDERPPIKLKKKMACQWEEENNSKQEITDSPINSLDIVELNDQQQPLTTNGSASSEMVECQCKTCGNTFSVIDPYNFRCNNCHVKYTSLPTHLVADPLQCIGCCAIFPHKPALKAHQTVPDKERPFRCCKCGYGFRQKAHLQKHQWRIHRRKLEPDPSLKEAEAFFEVIRSSTAVNVRDISAGPAPSSVASITMQDIINQSVEKSLSEGPRSMMKTSSKYYSEVLGLEYEPKSSSSSEEEDDESKDQPLDLSPTKKHDNSPQTATVDLKLRDLVSKLPFDNLLAAARERHPLLNQPLPLPPTTSTNPNNDYPAWKKQKMQQSSVATHTTLPPISGLQKPMSLVVKNYKHSSWIPATTTTAVTEQQQSSMNTVTVVTKADNNNYIRTQLDLIRSHNARTV